MPEQPISPAVLGSAVLDRARASSPIKPNETVTLFPTYAARSADNRWWEFELRGCIFEAEEDSRLRRLSIDALFRRLKLQDPVAAAIARTRIMAFLVDNEGGKAVTVMVAGHVCTLGRSTEDGHFGGRFRLTTATAEAHAKDGVLDVVAILPPGDRRMFQTRLFLVEPEGLTIVSDIDDTIKITEVHNRKLMLRRTFAMQFEGVPGMAERYSSWLATTGGHLHFVSSSPWQLSAPLVEFLDSAGFPIGTYDLKRVRPKSVRKTLASLKADPMATKPPFIRALMAVYPRRRLVLVGDSGEKDPEVYGSIAREAPGRIARIYIRNVTNEPQAAPRYRYAFKGVPDDLWVVFTDVSELPEMP
ncbi:phosphatidate phosphatase App1 family protein [Antrihabitans sp. NCIMB 15449]|uniref:Phosphatidate phosphatase App1 family protein n=1 Tax=Antrihabitans spumae TaxID=3373370 RepID=A0ABW7JTF1_9NOCA